MNCQRCDGLMVRDRAYDLQDTHIHCDVWRCVCCGNIVEHLILVNQAKLRLGVQQGQKVGEYRERTAA